MPPSAERLPGPPHLLRRGPYPWTFVSARHGGRRGIRCLPGGQLSLLLDYGLSGYLDFWDGDVLHYLGDGVTGDQVLTPACALLFGALEDGASAQVWERLAPNVWYDLGLLRLVGMARRELGGRQVFDFSLVVGS